MERLNLFLTLLIISRMSIARGDCNNRNLPVYTVKCHGVEDGEVYSGMRVIIFEDADHAKGVNLDNMFPDGDVLIVLNGNCPIDKATDMDVVCNPRNTTTFISVAATDMTTSSPLSNPTEKDEMADCASTISGLSSGLASISSLALAYAIHLVRRFYLRRRRRNTEETQGETEL
ncbi:uncharacterized protein LOC106174641 isoform X1 [Lingula anatina]|uniref:Uncharacterized protein LOC106174641 isoform X1 n=1 Tax=Lingula anatina TaxID=7574 RepID=A0A1S3JMZ2_LINAN|nr:uncharacterized protein LOC106174641 isoform X1 [Lingula anatina]|eukprot:XP_013411748.1 uncharacterized protein LOC106174641 isoform X1 [Lingula anatina]